MKNTKTLGEILLQFHYIAVKAGIEFDPFSSWRNEYSKRPSCQKHLSKNYDDYMKCMQEKYDFVLQKISDDLEERIVEHNASVIQR